MEMAYLVLVVDLSQLIWEIICRSTCCCSDEDGFEETHFVWYVGALCRYADIAQLSEVEVGWNWRNCCLRNASLPALKTDRN